MVRNRSSICIIAAAALISAPLFAGGDTEKSAPAPVEAPGGFPRTIEHKFGTVTIPERPERVVSVGCSEHDVLLALGPGRTWRRNA